MEDRLIISCATGLADVKVYGRHGEWAITPVLAVVDGAIIGREDIDLRCVTHAPTGLRICTTGNQEDAEIIMATLPEKTDFGMYPAMDQDELQKMYALQRHSRFVAPIKEVLKQYADFIIPG